MTFRLREEKREEPTEVWLETMNDGRIILKAGRSAYSILAIKPNGQVETYGGLNEELGFKLNGSRIAVEHS